MITVPANPPKELSADSDSSQSVQPAYSENCRLFLADEEEDDHVDRLNQIIELANFHNQVFGLSLIPNQQPTYERMLLTPSALQKGASGSHAETIKAEEITDSPLDEFDEESPDSIDSDDEQEVAVTAIKPFLFPAIRMCPFVAKGLCKHAGFNTQRGLSTHCRMKHQENGNPIILTTVEEDPLENGTAKIPCRWKCDRFFASYHAANDHSKKATTHCEKTEANVYPRPCPWSEVPGTECTVGPFASSRAESHHCTTMHTSDVRGPYQCHLCDAYYADLYALRSHVDDCEKQDQSHRYASHRVKLGIDSDGNNLDTPVRLIVVARTSGSKAPLSWFAGCELAIDGVRRFAARVMEDFKSDLACGQAGTIFHARILAKTRHVPTERLNMAFRETHPHVRQNLNNAWKYTKAIKDDLICIAKFVKPTIMSIGIDGFACKIENIAAFMKRNADFVLVIRETELVYGMQEQYFPRHQSGLYYGSFESADIVRSVDTGVPTSAGITNLFEAWKGAQGWKDDNARRRVGRNGNHRRVFRFGPQTVS